MALVNDNNRRQPNAVYKDNDGILHSAVVEVDVDGNLKISGAGMFKDNQGNAVSPTVANEFDAPNSGVPNKNYMLVGGYNFSEDAFNPLTIDKTTKGLMTTSAVYNRDNLKTASATGASLSAATSDAIQGLGSTIQIISVLSGLNGGQYEVTIIYCDTFA